MIETQEEVFKKVKKALNNKELALIVYRKGQIEVVDTLDIPITFREEKATIGTAILELISKNEILENRVEILEKKIQALIDLQKGE